MKKKFALFTFFAIIFSVFFIEYIQAEKESSPQEEKFKGLRQRNMERLKEMGIDAKHFE